MVTATFYCDESGNSGANYIDPAQPFFAVGGFLIPDVKLLDAALVVERVRVRSLPQARELKAATVLRRTSGPGVVADIVSQLVGLPALPLFVLAEKRFCLSAKVIETFLDPAYNVKITNFFTTDRRVKGQLANDLLRLLSPEALDLFAAAYRNPTEEALREALVLLGMEAGSRLSPEVAALLSGAEPHLTDIAESEGWHKGRLNGINLPAVLSLFQMVELAARALDTTVSKFVHDEIATYEDAYRETFLSFRAVGTDVIKYPNGHPGLTGLKSIVTFETQASHASPFIQAADLMVGAITRVAQKALNGTKLAMDERDLGRRLFAPALVGAEPVTVWNIVSEAFIEKLARVLELGESSDTTPLPRDPLLPLVGTNRVAQADSSPRAPFPCPLWVISDTTGTFLKVCQVSPASGLSPDDDIYVPIFSSRALADGFLSMHYPNDRLLRVECHCDSLERMHLALNAFREAQGVANLVTIDPNEREPWPCMTLESTIAQFDAILDRSRRAAETGVVHTLLQRHVVEGRAFTTYLLSSGMYAAEEDTRQVVVTAETRDGALVLAVQQSKMGREDAQPEAFSSRSSAT